MATNTNTLNGDLYILSDPSNPVSSRSSNINPSTTIDQVYDQNDIDSKTAKYKTLRKILEELEELIRQGGDITFPVTSVNGKSGFTGDRKSDVVITAEDIGLGKVENIPNDERPLGEKAKENVEALVHDLVDETLDILIEHVKNQNNPHGVNINTINSDGGLTKLIAKMIADHLNNDTDPIGHHALRELFQQLSDIVNNTKSGNSALSERIDTANKALDDHKVDNSAHATIFATKEDILNKVNEIIEEQVSPTDGKYPTSYAVVEYIKKLIEIYMVPYDIFSQIKVVGPDREVTKLPEATKEEYFKKIIYILPDGHNNEGKMEMAVVTEQTAGTLPTYVWRYTLIGPYSTYDSEYFSYEVGKGLTINIENLIDDIFNNPGRIQEAIKDIVDIIIADDLTNYYTKQDINDMGLVGGLELTSGPSQGTVTLTGYNYNEEGKSVPFKFDVYVTGLRDLAFKDHVENSDIADGAVSNEKIGTKEITGDKIADTTITADNLSLSYNHIYGNMFDENNNRVEEIEVHWFADFVINRFLKYFDFSVIDDLTIIEDVATIFAKIIGALDPTNTLDFFINDDGELIMFFPGVYAEYKDPIVKINEDGEVILTVDDDDNKLNVIERVLMKYQFHIGDDGNLYLKVPISYATLRQVTVD